MICQGIAHYIRWIPFDSLAPACGPDFAAALRCVTRVMEFLSRACRGKNIYDSLRRSMCIRTQSIEGCLPLEGKVARRKVDVTDEVLPDEGTRACGAAQAMGSRKKPPLCKGRWQKCSSFAGGIVCISPMAYTGSLNGSIPQSDDLPSDSSLYTREPLYVTFHSYFTRINAP